MRHTGGVQVPIADIDAARDLVRGDLEDDGTVVGTIYGQATRDGIGEQATNHEVWHPGIGQVGARLKHDFVSALARDSIVAVQFHPERSGTIGLKLLDNFLGWNP